MSSLPQQLPARDTARDTKSMQGRNNRPPANVELPSLNFSFASRSRAETELLRRIGWKGSPYNQVPSHQRDGCIPSKDCVGKVERGNDSDNSQGVPLLHHEVAGPLGGEDAPVQHAAEADRVVANVDKLLR
jgi:hypothetical protein